MSFLWPFLGKKCGCLVMAAPKHSMTCSKTLQNTFFRLQHPQKRVGGPTTAHSGPKNTVFGKKWHFLAIFGQKMRFFGDGGSKTIHNLLQNLETLCFESSTLRIGWGALQLTTHAPKTLF